MGPKAYTNTEEAEAYFDTAYKKIKAAAPRRAFNDFITFVEDTYACSGMCEPSLFFYSQSIKNGRPV